MAQGKTITMEKGTLRVPDHPILPYIEGDGTGPDIWAAAVRVFDAAVRKSYQGRRGIVWKDPGRGKSAQTDRKVAPR